MSFNTKNYQENGDTLVIGGTLELAEGATVSGFPCAENQADSTASTIAGLKADFNSLLAKLKTVGLMQSESE